jgi:hypothetical protein
VAKAGSTQRTTAVTAKVVAALRARALPTKATVRVIRAVRQVGAGEAARSLTVEAAAKVAAAATSAGKPAPPVRLDRLGPEVPEPEKTAAAEAATVTTAVAVAEAVAGAMAITLAVAAAAVAAHRTSSQAHENMRAGKAGKRPRATALSSLAGINGSAVVWAAGGVQPNSSTIGGSGGYAPEAFPSGSPEPHSQILSGSCAVTGASTGCPFPNSFAFTDTSYGCTISAQGSSPATDSYAEVPFPRSRLILPKPRPSHTSVCGSCEQLHKSCNFDYDLFSPNRGLLVYLRTLSDD